MDDALFALEPTPQQRVALLLAFIFVGLLLSLQASQPVSERPLPWTRLTSETKPYWFTVYVLEAFLVVQNTYPMLLRRMEPYAHGYEDRILNAVWVGLLGLEVLMVLGVAVRGIAKRLSPARAPKAKTQ